MNRLELGMMASVLGRRLHISRLDADMTASALAEIVGVTPSYLSKIERGHAKNVKHELVQSLASAVGVRPEYLLGWSDDPLGEDRPGNVAEGRVVYEVNGPAEYRRVQELLELFNELTPEDQRILLEIAGRLRRAGDVRIVGE